MPWQLCHAQSGSVIGGMRSPSGVMETSLRVMALPDGNAEENQVITTFTDPRREVEGRSGTLTDLKSRIHVDLLA